MYWLANNIWTFGQQHYVVRQDRKRGRGQEGGGPGATRRECAAAGAKPSDRPRPRPRRRWRVLGQRQEQMRPAKDQATDGKVTGRTPVPNTQRGGKPNPAPGRQTEEAKTLTSDRGIDTGIGRRKRRETEMTDAETTERRGPGGGAGTRRWTPPSRPARGRSGGAPGRRGRDRRRLPGRVVGPARLRRRYRSGWKATARSSASTAVAT